MGNQLKFRSSFNFPVITSVSVLKIGQYHVVPPSILTFSFFFKLSISPDNFFFSAIRSRCSFFIGISTLTLSCCFLICSSSSSTFDSCALSLQIFGLCVILIRHTHSCTFSVRHRNDSQKGTRTCKGGKGLLNSERLPIRWTLITRMLWTTAPTELVTFSRNTLRRSLLH